MQRKITRQHINHNFIQNQSKKLNKAKRKKQILFTFNLTSFLNSCKRISWNRKERDQVMSKPKIFVIALLALLILSISAVFVAAQYTTEKTTNVTIGSDGTFTATEPDVGVTYQILGAPGTTGTVTADAYTGNPQPTATYPSGISLTNFIAITFNIPASDFTQATITINYTASEVQNIQSPYAVYEYVSSSNSYVALPSTVDTSAKTITFTLTSITDPLLAIGGTTKPSSGIQTSTWIVIVVSAIIIVLLAVFVVNRLRPHHGGIIVLTKNTALASKAQTPNANVENKPQTAPPNSQESEKQEHESLYSTITQTVNVPPKPEQSKINVESKPQPPISTTQEDKTQKQQESENLTAKQNANLPTKVTTQPKTPSINVKKKKQTEVQKKRTQKPNQT